MKELILKSHPIFEPDQLLTSEDLNAAHSYLEQQQRIERVALTTLGCSIGFNYNVILNGANIPATIRVFNGHAVTIDGYQVILTNKEGGINGGGTDLPKDYKYYIKYFKPGTTSAPTYGDFNILCEGPFSANDISNPAPFPNPGNNINTVYELLTEEEKLAYVDITGNNNAALPITQLLPNISSLDNNLLVFHVEITDINNPNCNPNSCNDKGQTRNFRIVPLIISKSLNLFPAINYTPVELKTIYLKKFKALNDVTPITNAACNWTAYRSKLYTTAYDNLLELNNKLSDIKTSVNAISIFDANINSMANAAYPNGADSVLTSIRNMLAPNGSYYASKILVGQDHYDFCFALQQATNEFINEFNESFEPHLHESISSLTNRRLRFIVLGALSSKITEGIDPYRYYGVRIHQLNEQALRFQKLKRLYNRIWLIIFSFARRYALTNPGLSTLTFLDQLQARSNSQATSLSIIPSKGSSSPLGERSIPSYLTITTTPAAAEDNILISHWKGSLVNYKVNTNGVFTYWDQNFPPAHPRAIMASTFYGNGATDYPFFRIDGHLGKSLCSVLKFLSERIVKQNLPIGLLVFDLKKLGTTLPLRVPPGTEYINGAWANSTFILFVDRDTLNQDYTVVGDCCMREYIHTQNLYYNYSNSNNYNYDHFRYPIAYQTPDVVNWLNDPLYNPLNKFYNGIQIIRDSVVINTVTQVQVFSIDLQHAVQIFGSPTVQTAQGFQ